MSLNPTATAATINTAYQSTVTFPRTGDYPAEFATAYDNYASAGVVPGAVSTGGDKSIIEAALRAAPTTSTALGTVFAQYWATVSLVPDPPNVAVVNDASTRTAAFIAAVEASIRDTKSEPFFAEFIQNLESAAKTVVWTITTAGGATFTSGVS